MKKGLLAKVLCAVALVSCICGCEMLIVNIEMNKSYQNENDGSFQTVSPEILQEKEVQIQPNLTKTGEGNAASFAKMIMESVTAALKAYMETKVP